MITSRATCIVFATLLIVSTTGNGNTTLTANLTNGQENPPATPTTTSTGAARPASFGIATFDLNDAMTAMTFTATIFNIDVTGTQTPDPFDNLVAAHIHASPTVTPITNAPVVWGFFGAPDNDNNPDDLVVIPTAGGVGGTFISKWDAPEGNAGTTLAAQLPSILSGHSYINFHTTQFGGGEIRGFLNVVPEPSTAVAGLLLMGFGLGARLRRAGTPD